MQIMFGETTRSDPAQAGIVGLWRTRIAATSIRGVVERESVVDLLPRIDQPVLAGLGRRAARLRDFLTAHTLESDAKFR